VDRKPAGFFSLSLLNNRYPALHGMRVLAVLLVLQVHVSVALSDAGLFRGPLARRSMSLFFGMDLFFIMSGFLIGTILLHAAADHPGGPGLWRFWARRAFRTFPLYYVVLTALALLFPLNAFQRDNLPYEYAYLTNYRMVDAARSVMRWGWSLAVEEHFYLLAPALLALLSVLRSHRARLALLLGLWALGPAVRLTIYEQGPHPWLWLNLFHKLYVPTHTRFDILIAGVLVAYLHHHFGPRVSALLERPPWRLGFFLLGAVSLAFLCALPGFEDDGLSAVFAWGTLTSLLYAPWMLLALHTRGAVVRFLSRPLFLRAATLCYGIYLVHIPIMERVLTPLALELHERFGLDTFALWALSMVLLFCGSAALAYLLHLLVEKPALRLRDRLTEPGTDARTERTRTADLR
jgi:peptidoglycan/LPS O-acetylase OafA/YrhL